MYQVSASLEAEVRAICNTDSNTPLEEIHTKYKRRFTDYRENVLPEPIHLLTRNTLLSANTIIEFDAKYLFIPGKNVLFRARNKNHQENFWQEIVPTRTNPDEHLWRMVDNPGSCLQVVTYPFPFDNSERVYYVGDNGNHRAAHYKTIGFPHIAARTQPIKVPVSIELKKPPVHLDYIDFFERVGLLKQTGVNKDKLVVEDSQGIMCWIFPEYINSYSSFAKQICTSYTQLQKVLNFEPPANYSFLDSPFDLMKALYEHTKSKPLLFDMLFHHPFKSTSYLLWSK